MLTPTSVELPAGTGDGAAGTSSAVAPAGKVVSDCDDAVVGELGTPAPRHAATSPAPADGEPVVEQGMNPATGTSLPRQAPQQESVGEREDDEEQAPRGTKRRRGREEDQQQGEGGGGKQGGRRGGTRRERNEQEKGEEKEEGEEEQGGGGRGAGEGAG
ncbi:unnamed protein product [Ectocarpus sp. CCAP 1310/34]|nr:unnamed protein product [Ectocarpus sp. CCAP 1310/34]